MYTSTNRTLIDLSESTKDNFQFSVYGRNRISSGGKGHALYSTLLRAFNGGRSSGVQFRLSSLILGLLVPLLVSSEAFSADILTFEGEGTIANPYVYHRIRPDASGFTDVRGQTLLSTLLGGLDGERLDLSASTQSQYSYQLVNDPNPAIGLIAYNHSGSYHSQYRQKKERQKANGQWTCVQSTINDDRRVMVSVLDPLNPPNCVGLWLPLTVSVESNMEMDASAGDISIHSAYGPVMGIPGWATEEHHCDFAFNYPANSWTFTLMRQRLGQGVLCHQRDGSWGIWFSEWSLAIPTQNQLAGLPTDWLFSLFAASQMCNAINNIDGPMPLLFMPYTEQFLRQYEIIETA